MIVCVGLPAHDGRVCAQTVDSLLAEQLLGLKEGVHILPLWEIGGGNIGFARNKLAKRFLDIPEASCIVFVDTDISWKGGVLVALANRPEGVIGATYRAKNPAEQWHYDEPAERVGDLYRVAGLAGGFVKVSREAFEAMPAQTYKNLAGEDIADYFKTGFFGTPLRMYGEDYGFCAQYREHGGEVWLDPSIVLQHHDGSTSFTGDPAEYLRGKHG